MKKDILATITFLTTAILFYLVQASGGPEKTISASDEPGVAETVLVIESAKETPEDLIPKGLRTRDS